MNNGNISDLLTRFYLPLCHSIIERPYGGRDFGSYKWATKFLRENGNANEVTQLVYCNDSVFIRPSAFEDLLDRIIQMDDDYICITEVFQIHYHVQSWFFVVSGRVFKSAPFHQYWEKYRPYSYRRHSIGKGEVGISKHLIHHGIYPQPLFSQNMILNLVFTGNFEEILNRLIYLLSPSDYLGIMSQIKDISVLELPDRNVALTVLKRNVMERIANSNTMHCANLILLNLVNFRF